MELVNFCVQTTYFGIGPDIYQQDEGQSMDSHLSPAIDKIYMKYFVQIILESTSIKQTLWLIYVYDTSVLLDHVNPIRFSILFTIEREDNK